MRHYVIRKFPGSSLYAASGEMNPAWVELRDAYVFTQNELDALGLDQSWLDENSPGETLEEVAVERTVSLL